MALMLIGALLVILGVVMAAVGTAGRGRLSQPDPQATAPRKTLEPPGKGRRLSLKPDLLGLGIAALGGVLILASALVRTPPQ